MHYRKLLLHHVLFRMNEATCASDLAKYVNVLDAIMWLKMHGIINSSVLPNAVSPQLCVHISSEDAAVPVDSTLCAFMQNAGVSWEVYANFNQELAANETIENDWEAALLLKAKRINLSSEGIEDECEEKDEDDSLQDRPTLSPGAALHYLDELRVFALSHQSPESLELISKTWTIENFMCSSSPMKQAKLLDFNVLML